MPAFDEKLTKPFEGATINLTVRLTRSYLLRARIGLKIISFAFKIMGASKIEVNYEFSDD